MKIFVFESVCGGGWMESELPPALATEGGAMLHALCDDLAQLPDVRVTTTLDARCPLVLPDSVTVIPMETAPVDQDRFRDLSTAADFTFVIAPELENQLARYITAARSVGARVIAPPVDVIELCSDKLQLARFLTQHGIPTIPTQSLAVESPVFEFGKFAEDIPEVFVVKPRFGAGSCGIHSINSHTVEDYLQPPETAPASQNVVQPLVAAQSLSVGALMSPPQTGAEPNCDLLPVARQFLSTDGGFKYLGGRLPWNGTAVSRMQEIIRECQRLLPGLEGYVGFDFLVREHRTPEVLLVEINPRLCTSYLGYRAIARSNLAARMLPGRHPEPLQWHNGLVRFQPDGAFTVTPLPESSRCV